MDDQQSRYALMQKIASLEQKIQYLETIIEVHHISKFEENLHRLKLNIRYPAAVCGVSSDGA